MHLLSTVVALVRQYHYFHGALHRLRGYSDRDLADMNIARDEVVRIAWLEAERRVRADARPAGRSYQSGSQKLAFTGAR